nr:hypothetical protein [Tanacetum cinerariifolium]
IKTSSTEQPPLKDKSMWSDQEKTIQKIDRLARSLLIQGLSNDIYSLIDSCKTAKDLWDALARHMLGSEYGEQDRKAAVLCEYETFKATEGELLLDTYIRYLQVINDLKKCGYSKDNCELNFKFLNNLQPEWKQKTIVITSDPLALIVEKTKVRKRKKKVVFSLDSEGSDADDFIELKKITALLAKAFNRRKFYSKPINNNLRTSSTSLSANKKQEFVKTDDKKFKKKDDEKRRDMTKVKCYNYKKEGHFAKDCKKVEVKDYEYYKTKMLLAKKDKDEQVLLAEDQAWMESSSDSDQEINANMVFMAQIEKVLLDSETSSSSTDDKISEVSYYLSESESESEYEWVLGGCWEVVGKVLESRGNGGDGLEKREKADTTDSVSIATSVSAVSAKMFMSSLPNVDCLSNVVIFSFFASQSTSPELDNKDLKQIDVDDLEEIDLRWQMAMLTMRAKRFLQKTGQNLRANGPTSMGFDMFKVKCYNCHRKGHFARECRSPKDSRRNGVAEPQRRIVPVKTSTSNALVSQCDGVGYYDWSYQAEEEPANFALMAFSSSSSSFDNKTNEKTGLGYNSQVFTRAMFDCDDYLSSESDCESWPPSSLYDRFQPSFGYHVVPPLYTRTFMPPKPDLVFHNAPTAIETDHLAFNPVETSIPATTPKPASPKSNSSGKRRNRKACFMCKSVDHLIKDCDYHAKKKAQPTPRHYAHRGNHKHYASLTQTQPQKHMVPTAVLTQSKPVSITAVRPVSVAVPKIKVTRTRLTHPLVTKSKSPIKRHITHSLSLKISNSPPRVTAILALVVSVAQGMQGKWDKGVIDSGCSWNMTGNMSYLSDIKELNGGYVAFGGNPKGGKISGKGKIKTGNLVRGLPIKFFENDNTYVACKKGKQHRASCKTKPVSFVDHPLYRLHMDLFRQPLLKV